MTKSLPVSSRAIPRAPTLLDRLGVYGMTALEPVILAALATESPLLLIGAHGTAKSRLLLRLSEALGLRFRHYNASLLSFDDLVGYPLPDADGRLRFIETPASVWGAEVVFLDEISRCRPDMQNRLFSIVHERRVQGLAITGLRHRWAAMNPPMSVLGAVDGDADEYLGSEPLDPALADRFPFIAAMPTWSEFDEAEQLAVIRADDAPVAPEACVDLRARVQAIRAAIVALECSAGNPLAEYVRVLVPLLGTAGIPISPRRAGMLRRNALAVIAAQLVTGVEKPLADSAYLSLRSSLPQRAQGRELSGMKVLLAHQEAWAASRLDEEDPRRLLVAEQDPLRRALLAARIPALETVELSVHVADGLASLQAPGRIAFALHLAESGTAARLTGAVAEQIAQLAGRALTPQSVSHLVQARSPQAKAWQAICETLGSLPGDGDAVLLENVLVSAYACGEIQSPRDVSDFIETWRRVRALVGEAS